MSGGQLDTVLRHLRKLVGPAAEDSDGCLLARFLDRRDEAAFAALLARHGPMVWGVCRRLLPESHDAEDAFQAAFLVLVRRARSLGRGGSLAGWLHAVACRVALRARAGRNRERPVTEEVPAMGATDPAAEAVRHELRALIDEELRRLPEKYRGPVLLCDVQGRSHEEAARQLGCPPGSMSWRLARGRDLLRQGLKRRGVALSAALAAGLLVEEVPPALAEATARAALLAVSGGALSGPAAALADATARALALARLKLVAVLLALGLLAVGAGVATHQALTAHRPAAPPPEPLAEANEPPLPPAPPPKDTGDKPAPAAPPPAPPPEKPAPRVDVHGDALPPGALAWLGTQRLRQADGVSAFAFSADGKRVATGGGKGDDWLHVWDVETGKLVVRLPERDVTLIAISPDGKTLAVSSQTKGDETRQHALWDLETGNLRWRLKKLTPVTSALAFSPDGKALFLCEEERVSTWDTATGEPLKSYVSDDGMMSGFALAPDGESLAVIAWGARKVIVAETGRAVRREFQKEGYTFRRLAFSPDGKVIAAEAVDGPILFLSAATLTESAATGSPRPSRLLSMAFTANGKELWAFTEDRELWSWDAATGKTLRSSLPPGDSVPFAAISPDLKLVAFTDRQDPGDQHALRLLDLATGKDRLRLGGHESAVNSVAFSPDGKSLASTGTDGVTVLWGLAQGHEAWRITPPIQNVGASAFSPSGQALVAPGLGSGGALEVFDVSTHKSLATFGAESDYCRSLAFSLDGHTLIFSGLKQYVWALDVNYPQATARYPTGVRAHQVVLDGSGRYAAATRGGAWLGVLKARGQPRWLPAGNGDSLAYTALAAEGATVAVGSSGEGAVFLFDAVTGAERRNVPPAEPLRSVALSPGGRILATGGARGSVRLFDTATGKELLRLTGHEGPVSALSFSADGGRLASGGGDTTVLVWDLERAFRLAPQSPRQASTRDSLWHDLGATEHAYTLRVAASLASDPPGTVAFLRERLKPVGPGHDEDRLARAVADLQDEDSKVRGLALDELRRLGPEAIRPLRELQRTATDPRLQARLRAFLTMAELDGVTPAPAVPRELRAVDVLEQIGTPEARRLLEELAGGTPGARLTEAAKAALGRLRR